MTDEHRGKIANSNILNRLIDFAQGVPGVEMSATQASVGIALMRKVMPDLTAATISGDDENPVTIIKRVVIDGPDDQDPEAV
jgi:hypothetical protein